MSGVTERRDVLGAVDWRVRQGDRSRRDRGPRNIDEQRLRHWRSRGGTGEQGTQPGGTLSDLEPSIQKKFVEQSRLPHWVVPGVGLMNRVSNGCDLGDGPPVDGLPAVAPWQVLIIHCTEDEMVPMAQGEALARALPEAPTWSDVGREHAEIYRAHPVKN